MAMSRRKKGINRGRQREGERGYALISLVALMTISLVFLAAAMPSLKHELQREREEEMFWRAQQVGNAICCQPNSFYAQRGQYPIKLEDLAEVSETQGKKRRFLRPSALIDPMTNKDWKPVHPGDPLIGELYLAYVETVKQPPPPQTLLARLAQSQTSVLVKDAKDEEDSSSSLTFHSETGPIIGVTSRSKDRLIRNYYGIETYNHCLFMTEVRMPGQFILLPQMGGSAPPVPGPTATPPPAGACPPGQICGGKCPPWDPKCRPDRQ
jgi:hypothetical protein